MGKSYEEELIKKIEAGIRALRLGTKEPKDLGCGQALSKLKDINEGMYDECLTNYKIALLDYNSKKKS